jgi:signal transduction histidine kinase
VSQATRLSHITERVLLATHLDRGEVDLEREPVDVAAVVRASVDAVSPRRGEPVEVEVDVADDLGAASADADHTQQVLINLLDNALKYGAAPLRVRAEPADGAVRISVADSGPGITLAEQQRIFEKFYRVDPQLSRAPSGSGLGLFIARELVQRMGGRIEVSSEPGAGATFVVELPRA